MLTSKEYYQLNKAKVLAKQAEYRRDHRDAILSHKRAYMKATYPAKCQRLGIRPLAVYHAEVATPKDVKAKRRLIYDAVHKLVKRLLSPPTRQLNRIHPSIQLSPAQFKLHIESQWSEGMSWLNYGHLWEIDHIKPISSFNILDPAEFNACSHFSNTRPLPCKENQIRNTFSKKPQKNLQPI